ncbi:MAG: hypothetical protein EOO24_00890 [Comamonadaceae bacterium]|nr:MAG: hypothetical protein EOO24_00890 [Comamonadaceae bacterium]
MTSSSDADRPYDADPVAALERAIRAAIASGETVDAAWPDAAEWQVAMSREDGRIVARVDVAGDLLRWREDRAAGSGREGREGKEGKQGFGTTRVLRLPPAAMQSLRAALARARPVDQAR